MNEVEYIREHLPLRDGLEQLAEECLELGKAALKLVRAYKMNGCINATPVTRKQAMADFVEEMDDVLGVLYVLEFLEGGFILPPRITCSSKMLRWAERLGYREGDADTTKECDTDAD